MNNLDHYIEKAKERNNLRFDRELDKALGKKGQTVWTWKKRNTLPNDETMIELAKLAGENPAIALADLNMWRSKDDPKAYPVYLHISKTLQKALHVMVVALLGFASTSSPALADNIVQTKSADTVYYVK